jgi:hypothetical protein
MPRCGRGLYPCNLGLTFQALKKRFDLAGFRVKKSCIAPLLSHPDVFFWMDKISRQLIALQGQMSFHPALTGNNGFCVRKIREQEQSWEANS